MLYTSRLSLISGRCVLIIVGDVDLSVVPQWHADLHRLIADHDAQRLYVDVDEVTMLDDTALGVLLGAAGRARSAGGDIAVICTNERLLRRFALTGFDRAVDVVANSAA